MGAERGEERGEKRSELIQRCSSGWPPSSRATLSMDGRERAAEEKQRDGGGSTHADGKKERAAEG